MKISSRYHRLLIYDEKRTTKKNIVFISVASKTGKLQEGFEKNHSCTFFTSSKYETSTLSLYTMPNIQLRDKQVPPLVLLTNG